jgi:hypothetical protein
VKKRFKILVRCIILSSCLNLTLTNAQILVDTSSLSLVKKGINFVYNQQFSNAREIYNRINNMYPEHPVVLFFRGMITFWENYPLIPNSPTRYSFEEDMHTCIELSKKNVEPAYEAEYLLANLCARGILLTFYANNNLSSDVFPLTTSSYQYIRQSFDHTSDFSDFYFFTGLYNYYREVYPKVHPLYKPLALLFPKGDRIKGLLELQTSATNSVLLKAESYSILSWLFMNYENNYSQAFNYSKGLHELYPANLEYLAEYIKNLLLMKMYDDAENLIRSSGRGENNGYFKAQLSIFRGILEEKKYHDNKLSQEYYNMGIRDIAVFGVYGDEFAAYAYFGLSRISAFNGDKRFMKLYRKKANELADVKKNDFD